MSDAPAADGVRVEFVPYRELEARGRLGVVLESALSDEVQAATFEFLHTVERVHVLLSLLQPHERERLGALNLLNRARAADLELIEIPLEQGRVTPDDLTPIVSCVLDALYQGLNVVVLARGELWRTGLVLGACLVAWRYDPATAMDIARSLLAERAGEAGEHEPLLSAFARDWREGSGPLRHRSNSLVPHGCRPPELSRFTGCLLAGALGDALGCQTAVLSTSERSARGGRSARPSRRSATLEVSAATELLVFVADGLIRGLQRAREVDGDVLEWSVTRALTRFLGPREPAAMPGGHGRRFFEPSRSRKLLPMEATLAIRGLTDATPWPPLEPQNDSRDAGALVAAVPVALASRDREVAFTSAENIARITHGNPCAYLSAGYLSSIVFDLLRDLPLELAMDEADLLLRREPGSAPVQASLDLARSCLARGPEPLSLSVIGRGGSAEEALSIALCCYASAAPHTCERALDGLQRALSHSGEVRSTGAVTGQLLGATLGTDWLPAPWLEDLELADLVRAVAEDLHAVAIADIELDFRRYPPM